ncbi:Protein of unknown function [Propionibacterium freudenreichii]|nr:Protein of unknown function [Propionibacterium freudenreichii]
MRSSSPGAP